MVEKIVGMPLHEFTQAYEDHPFELINGERRIMSPTKFGHVHIATRLLLAIADHARANALGEAFMEVPFVLTEDTDWVKGARVPEVAFYTLARLNAYKATQTNWKDQPLILVPDFVAEIVSPSDRYTEVRAKVDVYQQDGVRLIWVIDPRRSKVDVYENNQHTSYDDTQTLAGGGVLPDFEITIADLLK